MVGQAFSLSIGEADFQAVGGLNALHEHADAIYRPMPPGLESTLATALSNGPSYMVFEGHKKA